MTREVEMVVKKIIDGGIEYLGVGPIQVLGAHGLKEGQKVKVTIKSVPERSVIENGALYLAG